MVYFTDYTAFFKIVNNLFTSPREFSDGVVANEVANFLCLRILIFYKDFVSKPAKPK